MDGLFYQSEGIIESLKLFYHYVHFLVCFLAYSILSLARTLSI